MSIVVLLTGLDPLIGWGFFPTVASKFGGKPMHRIIGATVGTLVFAIILTVVTSSGFPTGISLLFALLSGAGWGFGQIITFKASELVGSSRAVPVTTAFQLLGTSLWGVSASGNWPGIGHKIIGFTALVVILIGARMIVWSERREASNTKGLRRAVALLLIGESRYWLYSAVPQATSIDGLTAFLPQAMGMVIVVIIYGFMNVKAENPFRNKITWLQIVSGFLFVFGALTYLISAQPNINGLATGFILSQTSVMLATLTGAYFLEQHKTSKEIVIIIIGLVLILVAASVTVPIKQGV